MIQIIPCTWQEIQLQVKAHYESHRITVDSYWEDHVLGSNFYKFMAGQEPVGFFAVHQKSMITLFHLDTPWAHLAQEVFKACRKYEHVTCAMVPTGDEQLLSLCLDDYQRIEKNAYFSVYTPRALPENKLRNLNLIQVLNEEQAAQMALAEDFWGDTDAQRAIDPENHFNAYLIYDVQVPECLVGFGVIEYSRILDHVASIGMYVMPDQRSKHYATNILKALQLLVEDKGCEARSGCWYYNHNSKKSIEAAGAYAKSRLLRFYF